MQVNCLIMVSFPKNATPRRLSWSQSEWSIYLFLSLLMWLITSQYYVVIPLYAE